MKALTRICILTSLIILSASSSVQAQDASNWIEQSPEGETFTVRMPPIISVTPQKYQINGISVYGNLYTARSGTGLYRVWSLEDEARPNSSLTDRDAYLDACADLVWESLLKAERAKTENGRTKSADIAYRRELQTGAAPGREYSVKIDTMQGLVHFYNDRNRIYVLVATAPVFVSALEEQFLKSFTLTSQKGETADAATALFPPDTRPIPYGDPNSRSTDLSGGTGSGTGAGTGVGAGDTDYNRAFSPRDVQQKARLLSKPEPQYTEAARRYRVSGTVVLRAILSATGEVTNIKVVRKLPHGLTMRSIAAARGIRFEPAQQDGRAVSQYIQIEYNFNLY